MCHASKKLISDCVSTAVLQSTAVCTDGHVCFYVFVETEAAESRSRCNEVGSEESTQGCRFKAGLHLVTGKLITVYTYTVMPVKYLLYVLIYTLSTKK